MKQSGSISRAISAVRSSCALLRKLNRKQIATGFDAFAGQCL